MTRHRLNACGYSLGARYAPSWMDWPMFYRDNPTIIAPGMVLTFALGPRVRVVRILAAGTRRGPASEARTLYEDVDAPS